MARVHLTELAVRALKATDRQFKVWDTTTPGFGVLVSGKSKSWIVMYGPARKLKVFGRCNEMGLSDARRAAKSLLLSPDDKPESPKFSDAVARFLETQDHLAEVTKRDYSRILKTRFEPSLKYRQISEIETHHVTSILDDLARIPGERKYAHSVIRRFFKWAAGRRMIARSPLEGLDSPKPPQSRERVLSEHELKAVWKAAAEMQTHFGVVVRIAILTGQRRGAIAALRGEWVDRVNLTISWPSGATKQKKPHIIPIGELCAQLIPEGDGLLFPGKGKETPINGWSKSIAALIKKAGTDHFVLHDLRRTCSTMWSKMRIDRDVREFLLGHSLQGIEGVYDRWDRMPEMREAMSQWEQRLAELVL